MIPRFDGWLIEARPNERDRPGAALCAALLYLKKKLYMSIAIKLYIFQETAMVLPKVSGDVNVAGSRVHSRDRQLERYIDGHRPCF